MKTTIVLAMHGVPPKDFPREETAELFRLNAQLAHARGPNVEALKKRFEELDHKVRSWPRTAENDPYYTWSYALADEISEVTGDDVVVGFNEFCAPSLDEVLEEAAAGPSERVIVVTPMMTRGGDHSEIEIPAAVRRAQEAHPNKAMVYAWPFDATQVAKFLAFHVSHF